MLASPLILGYVTVRLDCSQIISSFAVAPVINIDDFVVVRCCALHMPSLQVGVGLLVASVGFLDMHRLPTIHAGFGPCCEQVPLVVLTLVDCFKFRWPTVMSLCIASIMLLAVYIIFTMFWGPLKNPTGPISLRDTPYWLKFQMNFVIGIRFGVNSTRRRPISSL